jgi:hypothetical protein
LENTSSEHSLSRSTAAIAALSSVQNNHLESLCLRSWFFDFHHRLFFPPYWRIRFLNTNVNLRFLLVIAQLRIMSATESTDGPKSADTITDDHDPASTSAYDPAPKIPRWHEVHYHPRHE